MCNEYKYLLIPNHPRSNKDGYVYQHIVVAQKMIGRCLNDGQVVHHIDGNKKNNDERNLIVFKTASDHIKYHHGGTLEKCGDVFICISKDVRRQCLYCGNLFVPDKQSSKYCSHKCADASHRKPNRPTLCELMDDLKHMSYVQVGKKYNVSDNCIRKWINAYKQR